MTETESKIKLWDSIKHFAIPEFDSPDLPGSGIKMNIEFIKILDVIREEVKFPMMITSGYRTPEHNAKVSRVEKSEHTTGNAADIACSNGYEKLSIVKSALKHGIKRIGVGGSFIHLGMSFEHPQDVMWTY